MAEPARVRWSWPQRRATRWARRPGPVVLVVGVVALVCSGCGAVQKVEKAVHNAETDLHTVDAFTQHLQSSPSGPFAVTYATTGSAPATVVYAVNPAADEVAFSETQSGVGARNTQLVSNASGDFACTQQGAGAAWSCEKLSAAAAAGHAQTFALYTPSHWESFLKGLSVAAGLAGGTVTTSTKSVNGFDLECLDLELRGVQGTTTVCTTAQGLLGYVQAPQDATAFEITSYTTSPAPSLFALPPGATVSTPTAPSGASG
ncbi:MAG TPA: hypothetical protein VMU09_00475 [Acidimicrobiales bacterium]|nr:hypothetical protein [Acidimicrobiales bacterium]